MVCGAGEFGPSMKLMATLRGDRNRGSGRSGDFTACCSCGCGCGCGCSCCEFCCGCADEVVASGVGGGDCGPTLSSRVPLPEL